MFPKVTVSVSAFAANENKKGVTSNKAKIRFMVFPGPVGAPYAGVSAVNSLELQGGTNTKVISREFEFAIPIPFA